MEQLFLPTCDTVYSDEAGSLKRGFYMIIKSDRKNNCLYKLNRFDILILNKINCLIVCLQTNGYKNTKQHDS